MFIYFRIYFALDSLRCIRAPQTMEPSTALDKLCPTTGDITVAVRHLGGMQDPVIVRANAAAADALHYILHYILLTYKVIKAMGGIWGAYMGGYRGGDGVI